MKTKIYFLLALNAFFLAHFLQSNFSLNSYVFALTSNLILFIIPGLAWMGVLKQKNDDENFTAYLITVLFLSLAVLIIGLCGHKLLMIKVTPFSHLMYLFIVTNIGILLSKQALIQKAGAYKTILFIFLLFYTLSFMLSTYVANQSFQDSDLDLQGTSYSLIRHLTPRMLTDRKTIYNFSHPLLPAFYAANTILFSGNLEMTKYYYNASIKAEQIYQEKPLVGQKITFFASNNMFAFEEADFLSSGYTTVDAHIIDIENDRVRLDSDIIENVKYDWAGTIPAGTSEIEYSWIKKMKIWKIVEDCYRHFYQNPHQIATRASQFFFTALTAVVFFLFSFRITGSYFFGIFAGILYFTIPEVFVSLTILAYVGPTSFILISTAYLYYLSQTPGDQAKKGVNIPLFLSGFLCALTNHKTIILITAIFIRQCFLALKSKDKKVAFRMVFKNNIITGFVFGVLMFCIYGIAVNANYFFVDHIQYHFFNRIFHRSVLGYEGFFSVGQLWSQYGSNLGIALFWIALCTAIYYFKDLTKAEKGEGVLSLWFLIGAISFSIVDHRLTSHLLYITPPLILLTVKWLSETKITYKIPVLFILLYTVFLNSKIIIEFVLGSRDISSIIHWL